jgi:hypothetical protein
MSGVDRRSRWTAGTGDRTLLPSRERRSRRPPTVIQTKGGTFVSTRAQEVYEAVERLVDSGVAQSDAFRQVAAEKGLKFDSTRGSYYSHKRSLKDGPAPSPGTTTRTPARRPRKRETTAEDAVAAAIAALQGAVDSIQSEVTQARERAEEAQAEYADSQATAESRIEAINAKITALGGTPEPLTGSDEAEDGDADKKAKVTE